MRRSNVIGGLTGALALSIASLSYAIGDAGAIVILAVGSLAIWAASWQLKFLAALRRNAETRKWQHAVAHSREAWLDVVAGLQTACVRAGAGDRPAMCLFAQASDRLLCFKLAIAMPQALVHEVRMTRDEWRIARRIVDQHGPDAAVSRAALQVLGAHCERLLQTHRAVEDPAMAALGQARRPVQEVVVTVVPRPSKQTDRQPA